MSMPNQRKTTKVKVNLWMTEEEKAVLQAAAETLGMNVTDYIKHVSSKEQQPPRAHRRQAIPT